MSLFGPTNPLVKTSYNVGQPIERGIIPLGSDTLALQEIAWSTIDELIQNAPAGTTMGNAGLEDLPRSFSNVDDLGIITEGDGNNFTRIYDWIIPDNMIVFRLKIAMAIALNVSAFTSGAIQINRVEVVLTERDPDGNEVKELETLNEPTGSAALGAVGTNIAIMNMRSKKVYKLHQGNILRATIEFIGTDTLVGTEQRGIMPWYYFQEGATAKTMAESCIIFYHKPALDSAFEILRDEDITNQLDFSGVTKDNEARGEFTFKAPIQNRPTQKIDSTKGGLQRR